MFAVLVRPEHADVARVPAGGQVGADRVGAGADGAGDVEGLVMHPLSVVGPARGELVPSHARAVEVSLVQAERRGVQAGTAHLLARQPELVAELVGGGQHRHDPAPRAGSPGGGHLGGLPLTVVEVVRAPAVGRLLVDGLPRAVGDDPLFPGGGGEGEDTDQSGRAVRAVGGRDGHGVRSGAHLGEDVDDGGVAPALEVRGQVGPCDLDAVDGDGVDVVGADHQRGRGDVVREGHGAAEPAGTRRHTGRRIALGVPDPRTALQGRGVGEGHGSGNPPRGPLGRVHQTGLPPRRRTPPRDTSVGVPDPHRPEVAGTRLESRSGVRDERGVGRDDLAAVPHVRVGQAGRARRDAHLVGALSPARTGRGQRPAQARPGHVEAQRLSDVLDGRSGRTQGALARTWRGGGRGRRGPRKSRGPRGHCGCGAREDVPSTDHYGP